MSDEERKQRIQDQFRDERIGKLEKRLDSMETSHASEFKKLNDTVSQVSGALDKIGNSQEKLRTELTDAFAETQKKISEASVEYINRRLSGQSTGQIVTAGQPQQKRGGLDGVFDRIGPTIDKVLDRYANTSNLPFLGQPQNEIATEIVDVERQIKLNATVMYRNELKEMNRRIAVKLGLPQSEAVRVGASHA